jgi:hypothetical protein
MNPGLAHSSVAPAAGACPASLPSPITCASSRCPGILRGRGRAPTKLVAVLRATGEPDGSTPSAATVVGGRILSTRPVRESCHRHTPGADPGGCGLQDWGWEDHQVAHLLPVLGRMAATQADPATIPAPQSLATLDRGGPSRTVGVQHAEDLARGRGQRQLPQHPAPPMVLRQALELGVRGGHASIIRIRPPRHIVPRYSIGLRPRRDPAQAEYNHGGTPLAPGRPRRGRTRGRWRVVLRRGDCRICPAAVTRGCQ